MGKWARILEVEESQFSAKLKEMGCVRGVLVKPLFKAPFGDPIAYQMDDYTLSMRSLEAATIKVSLMGNFLNEI